jgi:rod shape-determining protein MreC
MSMLRRVLIVTLVAIVALFLPASITNPVRDGAVQLTAPLSSFLVSRNSALRNGWLNLTHLADIQQERANLQAQVVALQGKLVDLNQLMTENETLRAELSVPGATRAFESRLGRVVIQGTDPLDYTFTLNIGRADGVAVGQPAVSHGALLGKVIEVREHSSIVRAVTSLKSGIQGELVGLVAPEKGYVIGTGNGALLQEVSQGTAVAEGTPVITSGLGGSLPRGISIGTVATRESAESSLSQTFRLKLPNDPTLVESVLILLIDSSVP